MIRRLRTSADCSHQGSRNAGKGSFDYLSQSHGKRVRHAAPSGQAGQTGRAAPPPSRIGTQIDMSFDTGISVECGPSVDDHRPRPLPTGSPVAERPIALPPATTRELLCACPNSFHVDRESSIQHANGVAHICTSPRSSLIRQITTSARLNVLRAGTSSPRSSNTNRRRQVAPVLRENPTSSGCDVCLNNAQSGPFRFTVYLARRRRFPRTRFL